MHSVGACLSLHHTANDLTANRVGVSSMCKIPTTASETEREREGGRGNRALTGVFLNELVDMDPGACAPSVKHDPIENATRVERRGPLRRVITRRMRVVPLRCRVHDFGHRVESFWYGVGDFRCRVEDLGDLRVGRHTGWRDFRHRVGYLGEEVLRVGGVLPVAVEVGDVAMVAVVGRLR